MAGHTRWKAAKQLKIEKVPCIIADDLTPEQIKAFRLADNKVAEYAKWKSGELALEIGEIKNLDMSVFGFEISKDEEEDPPEEEFAEILGEENNYVILQFKTTIDWLNAVTLLEIESKKNKNGAFGVARVLDGMETLNKLRGSGK